MFRRQRRIKLLHRPRSLLNLAEESRRRRSDSCYSIFDFTSIHGYIIVVDPGYSFSRSVCRGLLFKFLGGSTMCCGRNVSNTCTKFENVVSFQTV